MVETDIVDRIRRMEKKPRPRGATYATCESVPFRMIVSEVTPAICERLGLEIYPGIMYLRLQRERLRHLEETPEPIAIQEGCLLHLKGFEKHATTRVLRVEPLPTRNGLNVVIVGCLRVEGMAIRVTPP